MDKIVYDSLYKFLVSIGLVLMALPFVVIGVMYGIDPVLISQEEYDALSQFSRDSLLSKEWVRKTFEGSFVWLLVIFGILGLICLIIGIVCWVRVQKLLDESQEMNNEKQYVDLISMSKEEKIEEVSKEITEDAELNIAFTPENPQEYECMSVDVPDDETIEERQERKEAEARKNVYEYLDVENTVYDKICSEYDDTYEIKRDVRISEGFEYAIDVAAVSKDGAHTDVLYDIKYYKYPKRSTPGLSVQVLKNVSIKEEYERVFARKAKMVLIVVSGEENLEESFEKLNRILPKYDSFEIQYLTLKELGLENMN